jgi:hypothetical protein
VILDAEEHAAAERPRHTPDIDRIHDVAEVQVPCRGRSEARARTRRELRSQPDEIRAHDCRC